MRVIMAQPRGFAPASCARSRSSSGRSRSSARRSMCATRSCTTGMWSRRLERKGARLRRGTGRDSRRRRDRSSAPMASPSRSSTTAQDARPAGARRHLPAGLQGPHPGQALCRAGPDADPDRPCRPSRGRRHHGPGRRARASGLARSRTSRGSTSPRRYAGRLRHPDDAQRRRHARRDRRAAGALQRHRRAPTSSDICYATQNRQTAVRELCRSGRRAPGGGRRNSSNSNRLREIGVEQGMPSYLIADGSELEPAWVAA